MHSRMRLWAPLLGLIALGCSASANGVDEGDDAMSAANANAILEIHPLDIWAQALPEDQIKLSVTRDGHTVLSKAKATTNLYVRRPGAYVVHLEAPQHAPLDLTIDYDGSADASGAKVHEDDAKGHGIAIAHRTKTEGGKKLASHVLYLGLRHKWFSAEGRPARRGNSVKFLMDGEEAWGTVHADLVKATKNVMASTWWWESDFELVRTSDIGLSSDARWKNTILGTLESIPAEKRILIGEFLGQNSVARFFTDDAKIRAYAAKPNDGFEMMQQANPTMGRFRFDVPAFTLGARVKSANDEAPDFVLDREVASTVPGHDVDLTQMPLHAGAIDLASIHQKFMVVDDEVAFIGGMNLRHVDWDSSRHELYDWRREKFGAWDVTRRSVRAKERKPDTVPRKDYMVRVEGPAAQDAADVFHRRWEHLRQIGARYAENSTPFDVQRDIAPRDGGIQVQVTATLPQPFWEHAIAETWFNAVRNAEKYIYIEDQYFRVPMLHDAIAARMDEKPDLKLIVVTLELGSFGADCVQTYKANEFFQRRYPDRYTLLTLRTFDQDTREIAAIDTHSKMLIVDDFFMSVGSANKNNRGLIYEAELNVAVADPTVGEWRKRIAANMLPEGVDASDPDVWINALKSAAAANDAAYAAKGQGEAPQGFVYSLSFPPPSACKFQAVGPDET